MGMVEIQDYTTKTPLAMIGKEAGVCWGADTSDDEKNEKRGKSCVESNHGRTLEFPDVYMILDGYSARVIREFYTHIGGSPTRLQASTRYIDYEHGFDFVTPPSISSNANASYAYNQAIDKISATLKYLNELGVPREDSAMLLPMAMSTKVVCKINFRTLSDMSRQRMCTRAYHEFRSMFHDIATALSSYSDEWMWLVEKNFMPKCEACGFCVEKNSCGRKPKKGDVV